MRNIYALVIATFSSASVSAQLLPFPDSAATWVNTVYSVIPFPPPAQYILQSVDNICVNGEDTLINSIDYAQVYHCGEAYKGAWRDDAGAVYYVPADSAQEFLLYDFTLNAGDSAHVYYEDGSGQGVFADVVVANTGTSNEYGGVRKVLYLTTGAMWIEGIGPSWGLFTEPYVNVSNYELRLECMSQLDSIHFPVWNVGPGTCAPLVMNVHDAKSDPGSIAYPNPTNGLVRVFVTSASLPTRADVLDAQGRVVMAIPRIASDGTIDLGALPDGVYAVSLVRSGVRCVQQVVLQH